MNKQMLIILCTIFITICFCTAAYILFKFNAITVNVNNLKAAIKYLLDQFVSITLNALISTLLTTLLTILLMYIEH